MRSLISFLTLALLSFPTFASPLKADAVLIVKSRHQMWLVNNHRTLKTYSVSLGPNPVGHKQFEGDGRTPEGKYRIVEKNENSDFHRALLISYPNREDRRRAEHMGRSPGGRIMIHGLQNGLEWLGPLHLLWDWTQGCIAVTNNEIDEIWDLVDVGTLVIIYP